MKMETILINNVEGYTFRHNKLTSFHALAFKGDTILDVADDGRELEERYAIDRKKDGKGYTLLPGMIDAHGHVLDLGYSRLNVDLSDTRSLKDIQKKVKQYARQHPEHSWIEGFGWDQSRWTRDRFPSAEMLDEAVADRPVWLVRKDSHAGWANSEALRRSGITASTGVPEGGEIMRDDRGEPTGVLIDRAMSLVSRHIPTGERRKDVQALGEALKEFRSNGITCVHEACMDSRSYELFKEAAQAGKLTSRIYAMVNAKSDFYESWLEQGPAKNTFNDLLTVGSVKLFADGAIGSRGAAMLESYQDDPDNHGFLFYETDHLADAIRRAGERGFQVNIHAIGDRANRTVIDAHEKVNNALSANLRHRIEHCQIIDPGDIPRMRELGLIASVQPPHAMGDMGMAEARIGKHRMKGAYAWRRFLDEGVLMACGSDFPIESPDPFYGMYTAVKRKNREGDPPQGWYPEHRITAEEAFYAYTAGAAYAAHQEEVIGTLEAGKRADFILTDRDPFSIAPGEWLNLQVLETWLGGEKVCTIE